VPRSLVLLVSLALVLLSMPTLAVAGPISGTARQSVIVVFKDSVASPGAAASMLGRQHNFQAQFVYEHALNGFAASVPLQALDALRRDPRVAYVEADQVASIAAQTVPTGIRRIFAEANSNIGINGSDDLRVDVDVAIIDTGIDLNHPDLNVVGSVNCSGGSPFKRSCGSGGDDDNGHGTHVAGTVAALDNGIGVVGVAPGARLHAVKVLRADGSGYISWIVAGIDYVTANAATIEVANMSLGCECASSAMNDAIANSVDRGVAYAVAAGNSDKNASTFSPANHPDVLAISALADFDGIPGGLGSPTCRTDQDDTLADFSNWGSVDIAAPGVCILSTWNDGGLNTISGTSMASPHAAGALALLASRSNPGGDADVKNLYKMLTDNGNFSWTDDSGDGITEPLLDVSNTSVFNPTMVSGGGGGGTNSAPVANDDSATTNKGVAVTIDVLGNDTDADGDALTLTNLTQPSNGTAVLNGDTVTYTPNADFFGADSFTYTANDGTADSNVAAVDVTVNEVSSGGISLSVTAYKVRGLQKADLLWSGATSTNVDVFRDGTLITTTANDGFHTDNINNRGGGSYTYQVCEAGTSTCSNQVTITFN